MDSVVVKFIRLLRPNWAGPWWGKLPEWTANFGGSALAIVYLFMDALHNFESIYVRLLYQVLGPLMLSLV